jgi:hypothetical protein
LFYISRDLIPLILGVSSYDVKKLSSDKDALRFLGLSGDWWYSVSRVSGTGSDTDLTRTLVSEGE